MARLRSPRRPRPCRASHCATTLAGAEVFDDDVIRPRSNPLSAEAGLAVLRGSLAPDGAVIKHSAASIHQHTGRAVVFEDYDDLSARIDDPGLDVDAGLRARAAQRRAVGRPGDAGVGDAPDPEEAARAGRARHGADQRRPHVRDGVRDVRPARRARGVRRRAARAWCRPATRSCSTCPDDGWISGAGRRLMARHSEWVRQRPARHTRLRPAVRAARHPGQRGL